jgi:hypothetical protein
MVFTFGAGALRWASDDMLDSVNGEEEEELVGDMP